METVVLRVLLLVVLFILLTGDYTSLFNHILQQGDRSVRPPPDVSRTDDAVDIQSISSRSQLMSTIKNSCLPKLICELNASHREKLTDSEKSLLSLISDTSISVTAEVTSKYHFAAHMGQLIAGVDGAGCHNFYPTCPFPGLQVLHMMKKVRIR